MGINEASFQFIDFMVEVGIMRSETTGMASANVVVVVVVLIVVELVVTKNATADARTSFLAVTVLDRKDVAVDAATSRPDIGVMLTL